MPKYRYTVKVTNEYLGLSKQVSGSTAREAEMKGDAQLAKWAEQERVARARKKAEQLTDRATKDLHQYRSILARAVDEEPDSWEGLYDLSPRYPLAFADPQPTYDSVAAEMGVPKKSAAELVFPGRRRQQVEKEEQATELFRQRRAAFEQRRAAATEEYRARRSAFREQLQTGHTEAVEWFLTESLATLAPIPGKPYGVRPEAQFLSLEKTIVTNLSLPNPRDLVDASAHKYSATDRSIVPVPIKKRDFENLYEEVLCSLVLRAAFRALRAADSLAENVVVNGWVDGIDQATGKGFRSCLVSCQVGRTQLSEIDLSRVNPRECFRSLKGLSAGPLHNLAPIRPILAPSRTDSRFVESRDVLADVASVPNLADMDWADFEHLVRGLFEKIFSQEGAEVRITRASRDQGVDAVAFDPDPIRGGKFIIQAKRYNNVVPVSAARDLYGTMINEGAAKGILVTTSHFGPDSYDFVKDKPITLISGQNLLHLFEQHGYRVRIEAGKG